MGMQSTFFLAAAALSVIIFMSSFKAGDAIFCHVCNSADHQGDQCKNLKNDSSIFYTDCNEPDVSGPVYTRCRVVVQDVEGDVRIIRSCATEGTKSKGFHCIDRTGTAKIKIRYCECEGNGCNKGTSLYASVITILIAALLSKAYF